MLTITVYDVCTWDFAYGVEMQCVVGTHKETYYQMMDVLISGHVFVNVSLSSSDLFHTVNAWRAAQCFAASAVNSLQDWRSINLRELFRTVIAEF